MYRIVLFGMLLGINGVSTAILNLYRHMDRKLIQFDFVIKEEDKTRLGDKFDKYIGQLTSLGAHIHYIDYQDDPYSDRVKEEIKKIFLSDKNIMGVHCHDLSSFTIPLVVADELGLPVKIIHHHSACAKSEVQKEIENASDKKRELVSYIEGDQFDRWGCSDLSGQFAYLGLPFEVFPNALETSRFEYNEVYRMLLRNQCGVPQDATVFGFLANVYQVKNPIFAIQVFEAYRKKYDNDAHMLFVGAGDDLKKVIEFVETNHLKEHVHLLGIQVEVDLFYSAFDLFLCPSKLEGFPNTLVEAQTNGCLCLVSDEITEMVRLTDLVQFASLKDTPETWASIAHTMIENAPRRCSHSQEIKDAGYDIEISAKRLTDHYLKRIEESAYLRK